MCTVPITRFACEHFSNTACVAVCSCCCFGVANDCLNDYMREFAKGSLFQHHRVRADLSESSRHWVWTI